MKVTVNFGHNHYINCSDFLRYKTPFRKVKKFEEMFRKKHTPASALRTHFHDIEQQYENESYKYLGDGAYTPAQHYGYYWFRKLFEENYGDSTDLSMYDTIAKEAKTYNELDCEGIESLKVEMLNNNIVVALVTPLMRRAHTHIPQSADIMGIDAGRGYDRHQTYLYHLICPSQLGGIQLGMIMTT